MTQTYPYTVVDVFTTEPLSENSLAVFPEASEFDAAAMQKIARELNLTETAFILPATRSDCAARVRIFTPAKELPFAGHPTVGTAFVLLQKGIVSSNCHEFLLEEEVGPIPLRIDAGTPPLIWLRAPPIHEGRCLDGSLCSRAFGLEPHDLLAMEPQMLNAGNPTVVVAVKDKAAVDRAWLDLMGLRSLKDRESESFCVFVFTPTPDGAYSRMFAPEYGIPEDPATGSLNGTSGCFHDATRSGFKCSRHKVCKRTGNEHGATQPAARRYPGRKWQRGNLRRRSSHADHRGRYDLGSPVNAIRKSRRRRLTPSRGRRLHELLNTPHVPGRRLVRSEVRWLERRGIRGIPRENSARGGRATISARSKH